MKTTKRVMEEARMLKENPDIEVSFVGLPFIKWPKWLKRLSVRILDRIEKDEEELKNRGRL